MRVRCDDGEIELTPRFEAALIELMRAQAEMMGLRDRPEWWTWGRAEVLDILSSRALQIRFGADDDRPADGLGDFAIIDARKEPA